MARWTISDGSTTMTFAYNPVAMTTPYPPKDLTVSTRNSLTILNAQKAVQWSFNGNLYTQAEYDKLVLWHEKELLLTLTDHLGHIWSIVSQSLDIKDRRSTRNNNTRWTYNWTVLNLGGL